MKFLIISLLIGFLPFGSETKDCDNLKFDIKVTQTTDGKDNGVIDITITKSSSKVKVYLYSKGKSKNILNVKLDDLIDLKPDTYMLVLQNDDCYAVKKDIIIK